jgi:sugar lactone lactonase YvrE
MKFAPRLCLFLAFGLLVAACTARAATSTSGLPTSAGSGGQAVSSTVPAPTAPGGAALSPSPAAPATNAIEPTVAPDTVNRLSGTASQAIGTPRQLAGTAPAAQGTPAALHAGTPGTQSPANSTPAAPAVVGSPRVSALVVLAGNLPEPDDVALGPDGALYVSDANIGTITRYVTGAQPAVVASGLSVPEGIVVLPDSSLIIAEQGKNRLVRYDPPTQQITTLLQLPNRTGQAGVDGISLDTRDPHRPALLVPDSPNGRLLSVSLDGRTVKVIGRGLVRPVAAWAEPDGSILVADEFGNALKRLSGNGKVEIVVRLPQPDDIVVDSTGNIYVNCLVDGAVHVIDGQTGADNVLAGGFGEPQGLALDAAGNLVVTDPGHQRLVQVSLAR